MKTKWLPVSVTSNITVIAWARAASSYASMAQDHAYAVMVSLSGVAQMQA